jgi:hypothetical protein
MDVQLLVVGDCPHEAVAAALLRQALDDIGLAHVPFSTIVVSTPAHAAELRFVGSPTFAVDGRDLFAPPDDVPALACRLYSTRTGSAGVPELQTLRQALKEAADRNRRASAVTR